MKNIIAIAFDATSCLITGWLSLHAALHLMTTKGKFSVKCLLIGFVFITLAITILLLGITGNFNNI